MSGKESLPNDAGMASPVPVYATASPRQALRPGAASIRTRSPAVTVPKFAPLFERPALGYQRDVYPLQQPVSQQYLDHEGVKSKDSVIGMALGSPRETPLLPLPRETAETGSPRRSAPQAISPLPLRLEGNNLGNEGTKQKGRWKMFGGLFRRKSSTEPEVLSSPFHQQRPTLAPTKHDVTKLQRSRSRSLGTVREGAKKKQAGPNERNDTRLYMKRAHTAPSFHRDGESPALPPKDYEHAENRKSTWNKGQTMLLQVDIPHATMERYSIMFGNVLKPRQSTLLVRRQVQLEKLKTISEVSQLVREQVLHVYFSTNVGLFKELPLSNSGRSPQRRATSPLPRPQLPTLSLFPASQANSHPSPNKASSRKTLTRSATSPSTISPAKPQAKKSTTPFIGENIKASTTHSPRNSPEYPASPRGEKWSVELLSTSTESSPIDDPEPSESKRETILPHYRLTEPPSDDYHAAFHATEFPPSPSYAQPPPEPHWLPETSFSNGDLDYSIDQFQITVIDSALDIDSYGSSHIQHLKISKPTPQPEEKEFPR